MDVNPIVAICSPHLRKVTIPTHYETMSDRVVRYLVVLPDDVLPDQSMRHQLTRTTS